MVNRGDSCVLLMSPGDFGSLRKINEPCFASGRLALVTPHSCEPRRDFSRRQAAFAESAGRRHECRRGTQKCVRHQNWLIQIPRPHEIRDSSRRTAGPAKTAGRRQESRRGKQQCVRHQGINWSVAGVLHHLLRGGETQRTAVVHAAAAHRAVAIAWAPLHVQALQHRFFRARGEPAQIHAGELFIEGFGCRRRRVPYRRPQQKAASHKQQTYRKNHVNRSPSRHRPISIRGASLGAYNFLTGGCFPATSGQV